MNSSTPFRFISAMKEKAKTCVSLEDTNAKKGHLIEGESDDEAVLEAMLNADEEGACLNFFET